jgi:hypothetical protein
MPQLPLPRKAEHVGTFDLDALIDAIVEHARRWVDDGIDLYPDGLDQFRAGLYPIFRIPLPPRGERHELV